MSRLSVSRLYVALICVALVCLADASPFPTSRADASRFYITLTHHAPTSRSHTTLSHPADMSRLHVALICHAYMSRLYVTLICRADASRAGARARADAHDQGPSAPGVVHKACAGGFVAQPPGHFPKRLYPLGLLSDASRRSVGRSVGRLSVLTSGIRNWDSALPSGGGSVQDSTLAGRKIQQLMAALEDVEQFHQVTRTPSSPSRSLPPDLSSRSRLGGWCWSRHVGWYGTLCVGWNSTLGGYATACKLLRHVTYAGTVHATYAGTTSWWDIENNAHVKHFLLEARGLLRQMVSEGCCCGMRKNGAEDEGGGE
eukprot:2845375-Rhodomonas_salina.1